MAKSSIDFNDLVAQGKAKADVRLTSEDEAEKALRLRKEWWSFLVKEIVPYGLSAFIVLMVALYCVRVLWADSPADDKAVGDDDDLCDPDGRPGRARRAGHQERMKNRPRPRRA